MKKFLLIVLSLAVIGYLVFAAIYFMDSSQKQECTTFDIVVKDSTEIRFIATEDIENLVKKKGVYPVGKTFDEINTLAIRDSILTNKMVQSAQVYTTSKGAVVANVYQREPVLRVISDIKGSFYVDDNRQIMPVSAGYPVYMPIATGAIDEEFAQNQLFDFAMFLNDNPEWNAWFTQIVVRKNKDVQLIPRVGDFKITLGSLDDYPEKLAKFSLFIDKGLNVVGWNRYSEINLKYDNQIVCTRK